MIFCLGLYWLVFDLREWNTVWYIPAWYGYLTFLDAWIFKLQGHSFISNRRRELLAMMGWSIPFWLLFEGYNAVVRNWYYVFAPRSLWVQGGMVLLAFATVLPACFLHAEFLKALGCWRRTRSRDIDVDRLLLPLFVLPGLLCVVLPLLWPRYCFWMLWGITLGIPDAVNYRLGAPSILGDLRCGQPGRPLRLLTGGLWAGAVWEGFNYWSRCKWIYSVPGFEDWKIFEMPLAGFFGFPVLAVEAFAFYSMICHFFRGGRSWEKRDEQFRWIPDHTLWIRGVVCAALFSIIMCASVLRINVRSWRPVLDDLQGLDAAAVGKLFATGIKTPEQLYRISRKNGVEKIAADARLNFRTAAKALRHAALALHKGMGSDAAALLLDCGIEDVSDLRLQDPEWLHEKLQVAAINHGHSLPRLSEVKVWIRAAGEHPRR